MAIKAGANHGSCHGSGARRNNRTRGAGGPRPGSQGHGRQHDYARPGKRRQTARVPSAAITSSTTSGTTCAPCAGSRGLAAPTPLDRLRDVVNAVSIPVQGCRRASPSSRPSIRPAMELRLSSSALRWLSTRTRSARLKATLKRLFASSASMSMLLRTLPLAKEFPNELTNACA